MEASGSLVEAHQRVTQKVAVLTSHSLLDHTAVKDLLQIVRDLKYRQVK